jgi:hypothetical protein
VRAAVARSAGPSARPRTIPITRTWTVPIPRTRSSRGTVSSGRTVTIGWARTARTAGRPGTCRRTEPARTRAAALAVSVGRTGPGTVAVARSVGTALAVSVGRTGPGTVAVARSVGTALAVSVGRTGAGTVAAARSVVTALAIAWVRAVSAVGTVAARTLSRPRSLAVPPSVGTASPAVPAGAIWRRVAVLLPVTIRRAGILAIGPVPRPLCVLPRSGVSVPRRPAITWPELSTWTWRARLERAAISSLPVGTVLSARTELAASRPWPDLIARTILRGRRILAAWRILTGRGIGHPTLQGRPGPRTVTRPAELRIGATAGTRDRGRQRPRFMPDLVHLGLGPGLASRRLLPGLPRAGLPRPGLPRPGLPRAGLPRAGLPRAGLPGPGLPGPGLPGPGMLRPGLPRAGLPRAGLPRAGLPKPGRLGDHRSHRPPDPERAQPLIRFDVTRWLVIPTLPGRPVLAGLVLSRFPPALAPGHD